MFVGWVEHKWWVLTRRGELKTISERQAESLVSPTPNSSYVSILVAPALNLQAKNLPDHGRRGRASF